MSLGEKGTVQWAVELVHAEQLEGAHVLKQLGPGFGLGPASLLIPHCPKRVL